MLYIASDHNGFQLKKHLLTYINSQLKKEAVDLGPEKFDAEDDYPDYAFKLAKKVAAEKKSLGILICGSGHGVCIAANKIKGARAVLGYSIEGAELARRDDDANIICLAGKILSDDHACAIIKKFLETEMRTDNPKYARRLKKIADAEK